MSKSLLFLAITSGIALSGCQNTPLRSNNAASPAESDSRVAFSLSSDEPSPRFELDVPLGRAGGGRDVGDSPRVRSFLQQGHDAVARGRAEDARYYYRQVLDEQPDHPQAHHRLAILADRAGQFETAEQHYQQALRTQPTNANLLSDLGYSYFLQGRALESERCLREALRHLPDHPHAQDNLELLYDYDRAESVLRTIHSDRQVAETLVRLFPNGRPGGAVARTERQSPPPRRESNQSLDANQPPPGVDVNVWLRQKMAAARSANDRQDNANRRPAQTTMPHHRERFNAPEITDAHINSMFQHIDERGEVSQAAAVRGHTGRPDPAFADGSGYHDGHIAAPHPDRSSRQTPVVDSRPAAPQWNNIPQQHWPQIEPGPVSRAGASDARVEQAAYNTAEPSRGPADFDDAARRAAEMGLQTGPGAIFPGLAPSNLRPQQPPPTRRELPGSHSQLQGQPAPRWNYDAAASQPSQWPDRGPAVETRYDQQGAFRQTPAETSAAHPLAEYDQMRAQHAAEYNRELQELAAQSGHWSQGPAQRPSLPQGFDSREQQYQQYGPQDSNLQQRPAQMPPQYPHQPQETVPNYGAGIGHDYGTGATPSYNPSSVTLERPTGY